MKLHIALITLLVLASAAGADEGDAARRDAALASRDAARAAAVPGAATRSEEAPS